MLNKVIIFSMCLLALGCGKTFSPPRVDFELLFKGLKLITTTESSTDFSYESKIQSLKNAYSLGGSFVDLSNTATVTEVIPFPTEKFNGSVEDFKKSIVPMMMAFDNARARREYALVKQYRESIEKKIFDGEQEPPIPEDSSNSSTLLGIDSNKNGIRDDVEIFINRNFMLSHERQAMKQMARVFQSFLKENNALEVQSKDYPRALACLENVTAYNYDLDANKTVRLIKELMNFTYYSSASRKSYFESLQKRLPEVLNDVETSSSKYCDFEVTLEDSGRRTFYHPNEEQWWIVKKLLDIIQLGDAHRQFDDVNVPFQRAYLSVLKFFTPNNKVYDGYAEPAMPDLDINDKTIEGIDANHDGIRDDIEIWINYKYGHEKKRKAMKQYARYLQKRLSVSFWGKSYSEVGLKTRDGLDANRCLNSAFQEGDDWVHESSLASSLLEAWTFGSSSARKVLFSKMYMEEGTIFDLDIKNGCRF